MIELRPSGSWRDELIRFAGTIPSHSIMAEVGSFAGESAEIFLRIARPKLLFCIDEWDRSGNTFPPAKFMSEAEVAFDRIEARYPACVKMKFSSAEAATRLPDGFLDVAYIDGDHRWASVLADVTAYLPKLKPNGWMTGHDWYQPDVSGAVLEIFGREPDVLYRDGQPLGTWVYKL